VIADRICVRVCVRGARFSGGIEGQIMANRCQTLGHTRLSSTHILICTHIYLSRKLIYFTKTLFLYWSINKNNFCSQKNIKCVQQICFFEDETVC
jgi:hypothetical protein